MSKFIIPKETLYEEAKLISFMIPKGLAAAVLAEYPLTHSDGFSFEQIQIFEYIRIIIYSVVFFSIIFTAISIIINKNKKINTFYRKIFKKHKIAIEKMEEV